MVRVVDLLGSRRAPQLAAVALATVGLAGCSADTSSRFAQDSFLASPYSSGSRPEATGSVAPAQQPAPYGRVESRPLPQYSSAPLNPPVATPRSYPSASASPAGTSGGGAGVASYTPPPAPRIEPARPAPSPSVAASRSATPSVNGTTIIVGTGDTLEGIARRYNVSTAAILSANGYRGPRVLQPGQQLIVPRQTAQARPAPVAPPAAPAPKIAAAAPAAGNIHYVNQGDTLAGIARRNRISVAQLASANNLSPNAPLKTGSRLTIPAGQPVAQAPVVVPAAPAAKPVVVAQAQTAPAAPVQKANLASATATPPEAAASSPVKAAEATGALPTFRWPVRGRVITGYGAKTNGKQNDGINVAVPEGTPVKAAEDGVVAYAGSELKGYGNLVLIRHSNGYVTAYAHASELNVKRGDTIRRGQVIGKAGQSGDVNSPQLHFEIRKGSSPVDPLQYLGGV